MTKDTQQVGPIYNQIGYHHLPYYDSAYGTLQPYPYTYQYNGYRYLNPHVYHLPIIYHQYAYHPLLWEQLYPYRQLPAIALAVAGGFLGIAIYVWEKYFQEEVSKHGDAFKNCAEANPYDFDAIQFCLKTKYNLSEEEALRVRNRFETLYKAEMETAKTLSLPPKIDGVWKTNLGLIDFYNWHATEEIPFPYYAFETQKSISGEKYTGRYNWAKRGQMHGVHTGFGSMNGWWMDASDPKVTGHLNTGNFAIKFMYDDQYRPIFKGTLGYGPKYDEVQFSGVKIRDNCCLKANELKEPATIEGEKVKAQPISICTDKTWSGAKEIKANPAWTQPSCGSWVWSTDEKSSNSNVSKTFRIENLGKVVTAKLLFAVDNYGSVTINGQSVFKDKAIDAHSYYNPGREITIPIEFLKQGDNTITIEGYNYPPNTPATTNPAGIYAKITIETR